MTWLGRQMMSYAKGNTAITYTYDSDGLRTSKTVNGVKHNYYYVDGQLRYEKNGDSYEIYYTYDADGRPILATKRDLVAKKNYQYYLITNTRGDVIETRNGDGNVNARFVYDAWGKLVAVTNASGTPLSQNSFAYQISLKYRGYVYDNETGLYYLQSRYYDPETGRFINCDDVNFIGLSDTPIGWNGFAYCENEPLQGLDKNGFLSSIIVARIILNVAGYIFAWAFTKYKIRKDYRWRYTDTLDLIATIASGLVSAFIGRYVTGAIRRLAVSIGVGVRFYIYSMIWNGPPKNLNQVWKSTKEVIFNALF